MKTYSIKTPRGYLANQGEVFWFEETPIGWALYSSYDYAFHLAERHVEAMGKNAETEITIVEN